MLPSTAPLSCAQQVLLIVAKDQRSPHNLVDDDNGDLDSDDMNKKSNMEARQFHGNDPRDINIPLDDTVLLSSRDAFLCHRPPSSSEKGMNWENYDRRLTSSYVPKRYASSASVQV